MCVLLCMLQYLALKSPTKAASFLYKYLKINGHDNSNLFDLTAGKCNDRATGRLSPSLWPAVKVNRFNFHSGSNDDACPCFIRLYN